MDNYSYYFSQYYYPDFPNCIVRYSIGYSIEKPTRPEPRPPRRFGYYY